MKGETWRRFSVSQTVRDPTSPVARSAETTLVTWSSATPSVPLYGDFLEGRISQMRETYDLKSVLDQIEAALFRRRLGIANRQDAELAAFIRAGWNFAIGGACFPEVHPEAPDLDTDLSYLTADPKITGDMEQLFVHLASQNPLPRMHRLSVAPFNLHARMLRAITDVQKAALRGEDSRIVLKMNALTDTLLIKALMEAGLAGVRIDLIVRGACMLPAGLPGQTDNIKVRSVIGQFLEHSRVFYFRAGEEETLYLSSADWMNRNMMRRVEVAWPVQDPALRQRIIDECLLAYMYDQRDAWDMRPDGQYVRAAIGQPGPGAQAALMTRYGKS